MFSLLKNFPKFRNGKKFFNLICDQRRHLNVHEHISYKLLNEAKIPTPKFGVAKTPEDAETIAESLKTKDIILKAQVLAGGRGMGNFKNGLKSGVHPVQSPQEAKNIASKMLNQYLVTKQTGEDGRICNSVMVAEKKHPKREFYFAIMMERAFNGPVLIASSQGGVNIEDVAKKNPEAILYEPINIEIGLTDKQGCEIAKKVGLEKEAGKITEILHRMYCLFLATDALLIEINPFIEDAKGDFFALDAKFRFDDNAEFRQKSLFDLRDWSQEDEKEVQAAKFELNYIALDGKIGCMVNGAGLAMATMDIIKLHGGEPANFLDVGGGATAQNVKEAFKIITSDPKVRAILVNIFAGIMRCDIIAEGIIAAAKELDLKVPVVCRLQGTNVEKGSELLKNSGLKIIIQNDLEEAAKQVVSLVESPSPQSSGSNVSSSNTTKVHECRIST